MNFRESVKNLCNLSIARPTTVERPVLKLANSSAMRMRTLFPCGSIRGFVGILMNLVHLGLALKPIELLDRRQASNSIRRLIWKAVCKTCSYFSSSSNAVGSSMLQWAVTGIPGKTGLRSRASSESVMTKSKSRSASSCHEFATAPVVSILKFSRRIFRAIGWAPPFGVSPALETSKRSPPSERRRYSAKMLRSELRVPRNKTRKVGRIMASFSPINGEARHRSFKVVTKLSQSFLWRSRN